MAKRHFVLLAFLGIAASSGWLSACYQPKEGCLDPASPDFDPTADEPCGDCCKLPVLTLAWLHQVAPAENPDTLLAFQYAKPYASPFDTTHLFIVERSRFFISNLKLVRESGEEVGVQDSVELKDAAGVAFKVENNFAKADRDIFQASALGSVVTQGVFSKVKFTLGLTPQVLATDPARVPDGHPLSAEGDTLIYEEGVGYIPNLLVFSRDTLPGTPPTSLKFIETTEVSLPLPQPFEVRRGFNLRLTLRMNYLAWFDSVDFENDSEVAIRQKIAANLPNAFSVAEIKTE